LEGETKMKAILAIGYYSGADTAKRMILDRCLESAAVAGIDPPMLFVTGKQMQGLPDGVPHVWVGDYQDKQQGEAAIGASILRYAEAGGTDWIVKVAGDTFHPAPGWAAQLIGLATEKDADLVATRHHYERRVNTQVYAVRPAFLRATWPGPQSPRLKENGIEPGWGANIAAAGLSARWHAPKAVMIRTPGCENFSPLEFGIRYDHAHVWVQAKGWKIDGAQEPDKDIKVSVVMPARDETGTDHEGRQLLPMTLASIADTSRDFGMPETIIVDDGSKSALPLEAPADLPLRLFRNPFPLGVDPSRNIGAAAAGGDCIAIFDAHCKIQTQEGVAIPGGIQRLATEAVTRNAIIVGRCAHWELTETQKDDTAPMIGANFTKLPGAAPTATLGMEWNYCKPAAGIHAINGMLGASYFFPRHIWDRLGGFVDACRFWGYSEEGMALKAAYLGIPIFGCGDVTISHWFRSTGPFPFPIDGFEKYMNSVRVMQVCFEPDLFESFFLPRARVYQVGGQPLWVWGPRHEAVLTDEALIKEGLRFRAKKIKTDAQVCKELFNLEI